MTPAWFLDIFAALMLVVAAISAARLAEARPWQRGRCVFDTDVAHLLMGIAMAGMLSPGLTHIAEHRMGRHLRRDDRLVRLPGGRQRPRQRGSRAGERTLRAAPGAQRRDGVYVRGTSARGSVAGDSGMSGMGRASAMQTLRDPTLAFVFALILIGYSIWDIDQLSGRRYSTAPARTSLARVAVAVPAMAGAEPATAALPARQAAGVDATGSAHSGSAVAVAAGPEPADLGRL